MYSIPLDNEGLQTLLRSVIKDDDLLCESLLLMPIKSLKELKFVSKRWHSLITDPSFAVARSKNIKTANGVFVYNSKFQTNFVPFNEEYETAKSFPKRLTLENYGANILHSCNGLLCCRAFRPMSDYEEPCIYVYNPTTNRCSLIPDLTYEVNGRYYTWSFSVAFDPTRSTSYKVICPYVTAHFILNEPVATDRFEIGVYSSENNLWKHAVGPFKLCHTFSKTVYWNGAIFWLVDKDNSFYFNIEEGERHNLIHWSEDEEKFLYFGESRGHLNLAHASGLTTQFIIYEMEEDFCSWRAKYSVDFDGIMDSFPGSIDHSESRDSLYRYQYGLMYICWHGNEEGNFILLKVL